MRQYEGQICKPIDKLADETLQANADAVRRIADELLARRRIVDTAMVRIEGDDLAALLGELER
ncbi:hypothetical protein [Bradyrhizobium japonicum]|uniref:hypothetical protein n=1 Tax=Bradyrhizobium japonicum TaxID=375 RepID=UPI00200EEDAD|nr:hypothetical protein [Bradyrhizobium japonicum]UQE03293.1 hypothetical protein JEY30_48015 [Bradyrhizobium japonicum]